MVMMMMTVPGAVLGFSCTYLRVLTYLVLIQPYRVDTRVILLFFF